jgi:hypothetical protein
VQESAESVASLDRCLRRWRRWRLDRDRRLTPERSVWALAVVVVDVDAQGAVELALSENQQPVQAFASRGPHEAFGVRVGLRRAERRSDNVDAFGAEDLVKAGDEFRVAVAIRKLTSSRAPEWLRLRACWVTRWPSGLVVVPARWTRRV